LNVFGFYSPEDDDKDAIMAIPFPNDGKAVSYFIQSAKYQNHIHWDDCSLRKVVKDTLSSHIRDYHKWSPTWFVMGWNIDSSAYKQS